MKFEIEAKYKIGDTVTWGTTGRIVDIRLFYECPHYIIQYKVKFADMSRIWLDESQIRWFEH